MSTVPRPSPRTSPRPSVAPITGDYDAFVGRTAELASLSSRLCSGSPGVTWVHGAVGVGKTMLVHRFARLARVRGLDVEIVEAHEQELAPLVGAMDRARAEVGPQGIVVVDRLDGLRSRGAGLFAALSREATRGPLVVVDRAPPPDVAPWIGLSSFAVRGLPRETALGYLQLRGVPDAHHERIVAFARGRPLALALAADAQLDAPEVPFTIDRAPSVIGALRERLLEGVVDPRRRRAVEICALLRATTEETIAALLPDGDPHATFQWLRGSTLFEARPEGLVLDALARDVLLEGLRLHAPAELRALVGRAWAWFAERARRAATDERWADEVAQLASLARVDPRLGALADRACAAGTLDAARRSDLSSLLAVAHGWAREGSWRELAPALDRGAFEDAVRAALRAYFDEARLARSPLLSSSMVVSRAGAPADRVATLRLLLREAVEALRGTDDGDAQHRLLSSIYLTPSGNEADGRVSWMPYVTLRGHLAIGVERVAELLWTLDGGGAHQ